MNRLSSGLARSAATIILVALAVIAAIAMWNHYERSPWTRDGRVRADVVRVTPDIGGLVTSVAVRDNQEVKAGDLLFVIDRPRYALALQQADAQVASARATLGQARREAKRDLALGDLVAAEAHEQNVARVATADAALAQAMSSRDAAALNLKRTQVTASVNGVVTNLDLHVGDYVAAGKQAMALVDRDSLRVEGYFEETKLPLVCVGAPVTVRLMGEAADLHGRVESIAYGINDTTRSDSGNLLPTVQPTFSWVRLAQRIPVRVKLNKVPASVRLIAGRTATVTVEPVEKDRAGSCRHA
ncbi:efflux RND transporter periplasmic adaptor subunit [Sphingomonadales bacterium 56]|jgi:multidrug resistance efflux pump|uniref:efflux RND transporter periplasmic adaptor subunit n=1 Tax=unclassified Sphingobium TaxID=2611147 RepID=UPI00191A10E2|nr:MULTISPECIES: efflux RND transporter periplasmic adaptor subunit [unclassified Sphingobium]MBY2929004.1 efflux RND transporter periplasmic adaptor subunit [Sphingomonadales bacterium 56]MBY2959144.1 efflux RND transporter periplasmic adaptor subunit [Sphingomonadales bacterium 58]CAD7338346.1 p-hydroxybenzoic acid efflux pump subunit AaeA [Sphingobium sp. S6]CAD7338623.1 p-hydroxybenzoic acid efflux pump subunit AaeA [Sphingobium sp. S8]